MPTNPKTAPWPQQSVMVEKRIEARHHQLHKERLSATTAVVDSKEPAYMHHLDHDAKKQEKENERQFEIEAENARLYQKLAAIEDFDSSQVIQSSTTRSSLNATPGVFYSNVGGKQCTDHINRTACVNPHSLHYGGSNHGTPLHGSRAGSRMGSRNGSANPSPMRGSEVSTSTNGGAVWSGQLLRNSRSSSPDPRGHTPGGGSHHPPRHPVHHPHHGLDTRASTTSLLSAEGSATSVPALPPLGPAGPFAAPRPPVPGAAPRSRYTSPARSGAVSVDSGLISAGTSGDQQPAGGTGTAGEPPHPAPMPSHLMPGGNLYVSSPARLPTGIPPHAPNQPPHAPHLHPHPPVPRPPPHGVGTTSRSASPARAVDPYSGVQMGLVESGSGLLKLATRHSGNGALDAYNATGLPVGLRTSNSGSTALVPSVRSSSPSLMRRNSRSHLDERSEAEPLDWKQQHAQRKAELASTYLHPSTTLVSTGANNTVRAVRHSPYTSAANSRSNSPAPSRSSLSGLTNALAGSSVSMAGSLGSAASVSDVNRSKSRPKVPPGLPVGPQAHRYTEAELGESAEL